MMRVAKAVERSRKTSWHKFKGSTPLCCEAIIFIFNSDHNADSRKVQTAPVVSRTFWWADTGRRRRVKRPGVMLKREKRKKSPNQGHISTLGLQSWSIQEPWSHATRGWHLYDLCNIWKLWHWKINFLPGLRVIYLPGRNCSDNRELHNDCWLDAPSDYSCNLVIVKLNGIVPSGTIMGEYSD